MNIRKILFFICLIVSMLCLAAGYWITGQLIGEVFTIITVLAWLFARKYPASGLPGICLFASVCLAVIGLFSGSPPLLMLCGSSISLAVWDLLFLDDALKSSSYEGQTRRYEIKHLQSLAVALGCGLIVAFVGRLLNFQIPFIVMMLLVGLIIFGLDRVWVIIKIRSNRIS
jgi:hypothetical protein